jgi:hypothetical protein
MSAWSLLRSVATGSAIHTADGTRVTFRVDRLTRTLNWCAQILFLAGLYTWFWPLWMSGWLWWAAAMAAAVTASVRVWLVVRRIDRGQQAPPVRPRESYTSRFWLWMADKCDQVADESLAKAETAKDRLGVATHLHRAKKSREMAERYRDRAIRSI